MGFLDYSQRVEGQGLARGKEAGTHQRHGRLFGSRPPDPRFRDPQRRIGYRGSMRITGSGSGCASPAQGSGRGAIVITKISLALFILEIALGITDGPKPPERR